MNITSTKLVFNIIKISKEVEIIAKQVYLANNWLEPKVKYYNIKLKRLLNRKLFTLTRLNEYKIEIN